MKSINEKAEEAKRLYETANADQKYVLEMLFPELNESEDGKRKEIIKFVKSRLAGFPECDKFIAWLEKQGEQKPNDKVEPKFKVGDWVVYTGYLLKDSGKEIYVMQVASVEDDRYNFTDTSTLCFDSEKDMRSWTIQDAKDGDVLADGNLPFIFKKIDTNKYSYAYCGISVDNSFKIESDGESGEWTWMQDIKPATKEQCDLLFQKMKEAGYEWNVEKKELKKIEQKSVEWSADDLPEFESYLCLMFQKFRTKGVCTNGEIIDFVKEHSQKLKDTLCHVWSEDDERMYRGLHNLIYSTPYCDSRKEFSDWFKSIKERVQPQSQWKPSDVQMKALKEVCDGHWEPDGLDPLYTLYQDLKKLREE